MLLETRYAVGDGVLFGAPHRWLLIADDPGPELTEELWVTLGEPGPVVDRVVELLEKHYVHAALPSLALLDLTPGAVETATRGEGRLTRDGDTRELTVAGAGAAPTRLLLGGVVPASAARIRELPAPARARLPAPLSAPPSGRPLIDGVPPHILSASAPDRPADPHRMARALDSAPRTPVTADPVTADPVPDDAEGVLPPAGVPAPDPDHDGATAFRPVAYAGADDEPEGRTVRKTPGQLRHPTVETVLAVTCPAGHLSAAHAPECRVCHRPVPPQDPRRVPRPRLGVLKLPTGEVVPLDRGVVFGRKPVAVPGSQTHPHLVHLPADSTYLSRMHLQIELEGWQVLARDLGSQGGTRLHVPGREPEKIRAHEPYALEHGHLLDLADVYPVTFEVVA